MFTLTFLLLTSTAWITAMQSNEVETNEELTSPLIVVYYPDSRMRAFYNSEVLVRQLSNTGVRHNLPFSYVVVLCPVQDVENGTDELYVKSVLKPRWLQRDAVEKINCIGTLSPSVVGNRYGKAFNVGYNIRHDDVKRLESYIKDFMLHNEEFEILNDQEGDKDYPYTYFPFMQTKVMMYHNEHFPNQNEKFEVSEHQVFTVTWNRTTLTVSQTIHRIVYYDYCATDVRSTCHDYEIGRNQLENFQYMEYYYSQENQNMVLEGTVRPQSSNRPVNEYFDKLLLTPRDDFCDDSVKRATCTYPNVVPVWQSIANGPIRIVEKYIQGLALKLPNDSLQVRTIAYDTLKLPLHDSSAKRAIYLDSEHNRIPVPRIIIKIVDLRIPLRNRRPEKVENSDPGQKNSSQVNRQIVFNHESHESSTQRSSAAYDYGESSTQHHQSDDQDTQNVPYPAAQYDHYYIALVIHNEIPRGEKICGRRQPYLCDKLGWKLPISANTTDVVYCCTLDDPKWEQTRLSLPATHKIFDLRKLGL